MIGTESEAQQRKAELYRLDYDKTLAHIAQLTETRFKLLALLPVGTVLALGLADQSRPPMVELMVGTLGLIFSFGLMLYDQRNTAIYKMQVCRARLLELHLALPPLRGSPKRGGPIGGRPSRAHTFIGQIEVWHETGLSLIYAAVLGAWTALVADGVVRLLGTERELARSAVAMLAGVTVGSLSWLKLNRLGKATDEEFDRLNKERKSWDPPPHRPADHDRRA